MMIINADDFGLSQEVNKAIDYCFMNKLINQTTLMVNMPYTDDAVGRAVQHGYFDRVGLHLNLVEGKPLTDSIKYTDLCDSNGLFNEQLIRNKKYRLFLTPSIKKAVKEEITAQINRYLQYGFTLKHIDSHEHTHTNLSIIMILFPILVRRGFKSIRLSRNIPQNEIVGFKRLYKKMINSYFMWFNRCSIVYSSLKHFGSIADTEKCTRELQHSQELMIHPIECQGVVIDAIYKCNIQEWEQKHL